MKKVEVKEVVARKDGHKKALAKSPHSKATNTAGSKNSDPNPHHGSGRHHAKLE